MRPQHIHTKTHTHTHTLSLSFTKLTDKFNTRRQRTFSSGTLNFNFDFPQRNDLRQYIKHFIRYECKRAIDCKNNDCSRAYNYELPSGTRYYIVPVPNVRISTGMWLLL